MMDEVKDQELSYRILVVDDDAFVRELLAEMLGAPAAYGALQAIPRDYWSPWVDAMTGAATWAEQCSRFLWMGIRDGDLVLLEGSTSSSMPHKVNASRLERVWGMARLARGYRSALGESVAMWDERDLGHSSVERVALPGLTAVVATAIEEVLAVLGSIEVDRDNCTRRLVEAGPDVHSHQRALQAQRDGTGYFQARGGR
jgi:adenylosuccinate lyase